MSDAAQASFSIEKIYLKDASLESPLAPNVFLQAEAPQLEIQVGQQAQQFADTLYEVTITVTATARVGEKTQFLVEVAQAGIFAIQGVPEAELDALLGIGCPTVLYP
jgi:preprotein translocase subunit SecB